MARAAVDRFRDALGSVDEFDEDTAREYHRVKRALALSFQEMALDAVPRDAFQLDNVKRAVVEEMRRLFEGRVDSSFFTIRRYTTPHPDIFALLASRVGDPVPGWRIRLLSGDQIHTERRTRELRDLGLDVVVYGSQDDASYCLTSADPDVVYGAAFQLRENALKSKRISALEKRRIVSCAEAAASLPLRRSSDDE